MSGLMMTRGMRALGRADPDVTVTCRDMPGNVASVAKASAAYREMSRACRRMSAGVAASRRIPLLAVAGGERRGFVAGEFGEPLAVEHRAVGDDVAAEHLHTAAEGGVDDGA